MSYPDLNRWSAEVVMGWTLSEPSEIFGQTYWGEDERIMKKEFWTPLTDKNQLFDQVVDKMRELGWFMTIWDMGKEYEACFTNNVNRFLMEGGIEKYGRNPDLNTAVLQAAYKAVERK